MVELDTIRASDAPGPGSSPGGHTMKKNEFFKIRSFFVGALAKINPQFYWGKKKHFSK